MLKEERSADKHRKEEKKEELDTSRERERDKRRERKDEKLIGKEDRPYRVSENNIFLYFFYLLRL